MVRPDARICQDTLESRFAAQLEPNQLRSDLSCRTFFALRIKTVARRCR